MQAYNSGMHKGKLHIYLTAEIIWVSKQHKIWVFVNKTECVFLSCNLSLYIICMFVRFLVRSWSGPLRDVVDKEMLGHSVVLVLLWFLINVFPLGVYQVFVPLVHSRERQRKKFWEPYKKNYALSGIWKESFFFCPQWVIVNICFSYFFCLKPLAIFLSSPYSWQRCRWQNLANFLLCS